MNNLQHWLSNCYDSLLPLHVRIWADYHYLFFFVSPSAWNMWSLLICKTCWPHLTDQKFSPKTIFLSLIRLTSFLTISLVVVRRNKTKNERKKWLLSLNRLAHGTHSEKWFDNKSIIRNHLFDKASKWFIWKKYNKKAADFYEKKNDF